MGCLSATPCSWPCHFIHFQTPTAFCLAVPAGPVPHNTSRLCLKARINKRKQSARLRAWSCGNARRVCECLRRRPPPGQVRPRSLLLLPPGSPGRTHAPPVGQGTALSGVLGPVFLPEVAGRVWSENQPGCAGSPCPVRLCGQGWGDRRASSVEACSLNSPRARLPWAVPTGPCPSPFKEREAPPPPSSPGGLWQLGPLGQKHGGKAFKSKNSSWSSSPCQLAGSPWAPDCPFIQPWLRAAPNNHPPRPQQGSVSPGWVQDPWSQPALPPLPIPHDPRLPSLCVAHRRRPSLRATMARAGRACRTSGTCGPRLLCLSRS